METPYLQYLNDKDQFPRSLVHGPIRRFLRTHLDLLPPGSRLLDAGCGNGIESGPYSELLEVHAVDNQTEHISHCRKTYPNARYQLADLARLGFPDDHFAAILMNQVIEHLDRPVEVVSELRRLLKPGGVLIVATPNYGNFAWPLIENTYHRWFVTDFDAEENHVTHYTPDLLRRHLDGFTDIAVGTVCLRTILVATARKTP
jgi:SAM-dependent methyltransferase